MKLIPIFPLQLVLFPNETLPLHIFEPRYKEMISECLEKKDSFGICSFINGKVSRTGCLARIYSVSKKYEDGKYDIVCKGGERFMTHAYNSSKSYLQASVSFFEDTNADSSPHQDLVDKITPRFKELLDILTEGNAPDITPACSYDFGHHIGLELIQKQNLLEIKSELERLEFIKNHIERLLAQLTMFEDVKKRIKSNGHFRKFPPIEF